MESTGIYWVNLYDILESRGIEVCLANARYVRNVYVGQRENLEKQKALPLNLMGKSLQLLNVKLHQVASNLEIQVSMSINFLRFH